MKKAIALTDKETECVTGGKMSYNEEDGTVSFSGVKSTYRICAGNTIEDINDIVNQLMADNPEMDDKSFDQLCVEKLKDRIELVVAD